MRNLIRLILFALCAIAVLVLAGISTFAQRARANPTVPPAAQQPLFSEYKGIRLDMTAEEVRAKLGEPTMKADDQDYYVFSENETAQFAYDKAHRVIAISIDYTGPNAPEARKVVGTSIEPAANGSLHKMVRYEAHGFWVCYNRTAGANPIVTITIQKI